MGVALECIYSHPTLDSTTLWSPVTKFTLKHEKELCRRADEENLKTWECTSKPGVSSLEELTINE